MLAGSTVTFSYAELLAHDNYAGLAGFVRDTNIFERTYRYTHSFYCSFFASPCCFFLFISLIFRLYAFVWFMFRLDPVTMIKVEQGVLEEEEEQAFADWVRTFTEVCLPSPFGT